MADIRIKVAKDKAKLVKALRAGEGSTGPFQTYADVVTFAAAFGFQEETQIRSQAINLKIEG
jgi:dnd system-associated protein 4